MQTEQPARRLPIIGRADVFRGMSMPGERRDKSVGGGNYYFDERLRQLRNVNNIHDVFNLNDFEVYYFKEMLASQ